MEGRLDRYNVFVRSGVSSLFIGLSNILLDGHNVLSLHRNYSHFNYCVS